jgi:hypothetical protein
LIDFGFERIDHIVPHQFEGWIRKQMGDVDLPAGVKVVETNHLVAFSEETLAEVAAEEPGASGNKNTHVL